MARMNPEVAACGLAETTALIRRVDACLASAMQRMSMPPHFGQDGSFMAGELSGLEGELRRHLLGTREAIHRWERNEHIVEADQEEIHGRRANEQYERARGAIDLEIEQHRENEHQILARLDAVSMAIRQIRSWQSWRPPIGHPTDRARSRWFPTVSYPPWSQASAQGELDDLFHNGPPQPLRPGTPLH
jgi:hypothetical protein